MNFVSIENLLLNIPISVMIPGTEKNRKRDVRDYYNSRDERNDVRTTGNLARRGDIPIIHGDCDGNRLF